MDGARATHTQATGQTAPQAAPRPQPLRAASKPARSAHMLAAGPAVRLNPQTAAPSNAPPPHVTELATSSGSGEALPTNVQGALEDSLGVSLRGVRVHTDARSAVIAAGMGARAFTYGTHVFLGPRERATDLQLMAHEVTHVVQQQGRPVIQLCCAGCCGTTASGDSFEREASHAAAAVTSGTPFTVEGRTGGAQVQKEDGGQEDEGLFTRLMWGLLEEISPEFARMLREVMRQGLIEWLKGKISSAVESIFNTLAAPVREVTGVVGVLSLHFTNLLSWMRDAAARIARGDCGAITEAAEKIQQVFEGLAAPVIDRIKHLADRVKGFFNGLWERFGAPAWEFLRSVGGQAWEKIQQFGRWIWEKTARVRSTLERAWRWVKNRLGIGEGEDGQNGLLQWVQRKAATAWDWIKERIEPIKRPLMVVGGILVMLSPAGPVIAIGAAVGGLMVGIRWIRQHMSRPNGVVEQRNAFERTIIPAIMGAVGGVTSGLQRAASFVTDKLNGVMAGLGSAVGAVAGSIFRFAVGIIQWIADQFRALVAWGNEKLMGLVEWVRGALESLRSFLQPILNVLGQIGRVVADIMQLPFLIAGRLWNIIPACIRDPFVNFFIPLILSRIPLFRELVATPEAWAQTRAGVMTIIRQIFRDHDLIGAMKGVFRLLLRALAVPVELAGRVLAKAATAWDAVLEHPIQFLRNILRAMGLGFRRFFGNVLSHLLFGVSGWIFGELREVGVQPPSSWTDLRAVFGFVLQVLGISVEHIFQLLARRLSPERVQQLRRVYNVLTGAWEWVKVAIAEGPAGLWRMLVERLRELGSAVLRAAVDWIIDRIVTRVTARLLSMLDPTGIMAVVNALVSLYQAIQTVVRYARQILEIVNSVLDTIINIAGGVIAPAAQMLENAMRGAMPVIIAFLANQAGLSGLGARMREIIANIRERVDNALLWLIDLGLRVGTAFLNAIGLSGAGQQPSVGKTIEFNAGHEAHRLWIRVAGRVARVMLASAPTTVLEFLNDPLVADAATARPELPGVLTQARSKTEEVTASAGEVLGSTNQARTTQAEQTTERKEDDLASLLARVLNLLEGTQAEIFSFIGRRVVERGGQPNVPDRRLLQRNIMHYSFIEYRNGRIDLRRNPHLGRTNPTLAQRLPDTHLDDEGVLVLGANPGQDTRTNEQKLASYRAMLRDISIADPNPALGASASDSQISEYRGRISRRIIDDPRFETLDGLNALFVSRKLTGSGMQGTVFEDWVAKNVGIIDLNNSQVTFELSRTDHPKADRMRDTTLLEIKSAIRPSAEPAATPDDAIPSTRFSVERREITQMNKYAIILERPVIGYQKQGNQLVRFPPFTAVHYHCNYLGFAIAFRDEIAGTRLGTKPYKVFAGIREIFANTTTALPHP